MRRPLGQIKYLKDAEDDCDLDLELTVSDLLVDEGKALKDGSDQKRIVLVVVDQGRAVRQGSVIPDLTPLHYQSSIKPPVPKFPGLEKRIPEELEPDTRPPKRRRLDQIEEDDGEEIIHSIEGQSGTNGGNRRSPSHFEVPGAHFLSALNTGNVDRAAVDVKRESPGPHSWSNTTPATRDELELLPQQPETWRPYQRRAGDSASQVQSNSLDPESRRQDARQSMNTPITPGANDRIWQSPSANAINMLNGMKSVSPALRQPSSTSASRFRGSKKNVYDMPESDVEDSQMSPESRAGRKPITPKLVQAPRPIQTNSTGKKSYRPGLLQKPANLVNAHDESTLLPDGTEVLDRDLSIDEKNAELDVQMDNAPSWTRDGFAKLSQPASGQDYDEDEVDTIEQRRAITCGKESTFAEENNNSVARESEPTASSKGERSSSGVASASRSSSVASAASGTGRSTSSRSTSKRISYARERKTMTENEDDETLDSPGIQLEENLRQSSPTQRKSTESRTRTSASKSQAREDVDEILLASDRDSENEEDIARPPDSVSDFEEAVQTAKKEKNAIRKKADNAVSQRKTHKAKVSGNGELRCFTCWSKQSLCDNTRPKCSYCVKWKKNCQIYDMTKEAADEEREDRQRRKRSAPRPPSRGSTIPSRNKVRLSVSDEVVSASDRDDESESEEDKEEEETATQKVKSVAKKRLNNGKFEIKVPAVEKQDPGTKEPPRRKLKIDKKKVVESTLQPQVIDAVVMDKDIETSEHDAAQDVASKSNGEPSKPNIPQDHTVEREKDQKSTPLKTNTVVKKERAKNPTSAFGLDTHCAVPLESGEPCTRSLTCKIHGVGKKRAVPGRSQPFDSLLKQHLGGAKQVTSEKSNSEATVSKPPQADEPLHQPKISANVKKPSIVNEKSVESGSTKSQSVRAPSVDSRAALSGRTIPPWMTEEEYDRLVNDRAGYMRPESKPKAPASRKSTTSQKDVSPLVVRTQGSQDTAQQLKKTTSSVKSDDKVTSSSQASTKRRQAPSSTQPEPNSHTFATATTPGPVNTLLPKSLPSNSARQTASDVRLNGRLKTHPVLANTAAAISSDKHANPPFRQPHKKQLLSNGATAVRQEVGEARSLKDLKAVLKSSGSGASTPQPQSVKSRPFGLNNSVQAKKGFQLDDEEEEEDETESEDESPIREENKPKTPRFIPVNDTFNLLARARQHVPVEDNVESDDSDDGTEW